MTMIDTGVVNEESTDETAVWSEVDEGFWVGNDSGEFLGSIERLGARYRAHGSANDSVGTFSSLSRAREAIVAHG